MAKTDYTPTHAYSLVSGPGFVRSEVVTVDCSAHNKAQNAVDNLFDVVQGEYVLTVVANVTTVEDSTCTFDVGDGTTVENFVDGQNAENLGVTRTNGTATLAGGIPYNAADTIDVKWLNAADTAVVEFTKISILGTPAGT